MWRPPLCGHHLTPCVSVLLGAKGLSPQSQAARIHIYAPPFPTRYPEPRGLTLHQPLLCIFKGLTILCPSQGLGGLSALLLPKRALSTAPSTCWEKWGLCLSLLFRQQVTALPPVSPKQSETPEVKVLQDRLAATNLKMSDLRNQIQSVKQELRVAQKVFQSQASSHLVWLGLTLGGGRTGTMGPIQDP